jgi:hypothetical protein
MPKRSRKSSSKRKNPAAVALGRLGGLKGGKARMAKLSASDRSELGRKAVTARTAKLSPRMRSELARRAVTARWAKRNKDSNTA